MVRIYYREDKILKKETDVREIGSLTDILWVDLHSPTQEEEEWIESKCEVSIQTPQEITEIESSSRYFERNGMIVANSNFLRFEGDTFQAYPVSFIIKGPTVFTFRQGDSKTFADTVKKMRVNSDTLLTGTDVLLLIFETRIDSDADSLEAISREITNISRKLAKERKPKGDSLLQINNLQEHTMLLRESIIDKQRVFSALLRSMNFPDDKKERLRIILKDINSLLEYTTFNFERLEYLQDTFTGLINLEQNDIIKRFTLFSIIFLPPTLIAGIFGMNYKEIPTADSEYGFYFALFIIIGSSLGSLLFFKWKNWI
ncbi:MAG: magnesium/cobalt transporter CorA [Bacteroidia bacterium]|nr:magnesium/cobalt transporter CorA [Bacteroidia bacterium]